MSRCSFFIMLNKILFIFIQSIISAILLGIGFFFTIYYFSMLPLFIMFFIGAIIEYFIREHKRKKTNNLSSDSE